MSKYVPTMTHEERRKRHARMADALRRGYYVGEVAAQFGVACTTVRYVAIKFGISPAAAPRGKHHPMADHWLTVDWAQQDVVIADSLGVSRQRVHQVRSKLGKPPSPNHRQKRSASAGGAQ